MHSSEVVGSSTRESSKRMLQLLLRCHMSLEKFCLIHGYAAFQCAGVLGRGYLPLKSAPTATSFIGWRREDTKRVAK